MSPSLVLWAGAAATLVTGAAAELTLDERVNLYINFGATALAPGRYDCKAWVGLFAANGTAAAPGAPLVVGRVLGRRRRRPRLLDAPDDSRRGARRRRPLVTARAPCDRGHRARPACCAAC